MESGKASSATFWLRQIKEKRLNPKNLTTHQRRLCVRHFMDSNPELSQRQMAEILGTTHPSVARYINDIIKQDVRIVQFDPYEHAVDLKKRTAARINKVHMLAHKLETQAIPDHFHAGVLWQKAHEMEMDYIEKLQDLGVLPKIATPIEIKGSVEATLTLQEIVKLAVGTHLGRGENPALGRAGGGLAAAGQN